MSTSLRHRPTPGVADATGALRQRRRQSRQRLALRLAVVALVLGLVGAAVWVVGFSALLAAERVEVTGAEILPEPDVVRTAGVPLGRPLARVAVGEIETRVATLAPARSVQVDRVWPHTVRITVVERTPAYVVTTNGTTTLVDADGIPFGTVTERPEDLLRADVALDDPVLLRSVATVVAALPAGVRAEVDRVEASSPESIRLRLDGNREVVWGGADQSAVKGEVLAALLGKKARVYDVSGPANPTTRG